MKFRLTESQDAALVSELAAALEEAVDRSCPETAALWLAATIRCRSELMHTELTLGFAPSAKFLALGRSSRTKYRSLAVWRHAVLWKEVLPKLKGDQEKQALEAVYFTPFPQNTPPYAWSSAASNAPGIQAFDGPRQLKRLAKLGAEKSVRSLCAYIEKLDKTQLLGELTYKLIKPGVSTSACDVLKLEKTDLYGMTQ